MTDFVARFTVPVRQKVSIQVTPEERESAKAVLKLYARPEIVDVTASVDNTVGTPSVDVTLGGDGLSRSFDFAFHNLKGDKGDTGTAASIIGATASVTNTVGTPSVTVTAGGTDAARSFDFAFDNLKGNQGETGPSGVYIGTTEPTDPAVEVWLNPDGTQGKTSQLINDGEGTEPFITDSDVGNGTITFTQEGETIGTITTNQKTNSTIAIGQSGTKVIWRIWE